MRLDELFTSAARSSGSHTSAAVSIAGNLGGRFYLVASAVTGTAPSVYITVQSLDEGSDTFIDVPSAVSKTLAAAGSTTLSVYPGIAETTNISVSDVLGEVIRVVASVAGSPSDTVTFSVGAEVWD